MRSSYVIKHLFLIFLIVVDFILNSLIDHYVNESLTLSLSGLQLIIRICQFFTILSFMWSTFVFKYGLLGVLMANFKLLILVAAISLILLITVRSLRINRILNYDDDPTFRATNISTLLMNIWNEDGFAVLLGFHIYFTIFYSVLLLKTAFELSNPIYYKAEKWIDTSQT